MQKYDNILIQTKIEDLTEDKTYVYVFTDTNGNTFFSKAVIENDMLKTSLPKESNLLAITIVEFE